MKNELKRITSMLESFDKDLVNLGAQILAKLPDSDLLEVHNHYFKSNPLYVYSVMEGNEDCKEYISRLENLLETSIEFDPRGTGTISLSTGKDEYTMKYIDYIRSTPHNSNRINID